MAIIITAASSKGGCGKTTTIAILAGEYRSRGLKVHIIDADTIKRAARWAKTAPSEITVSEADSQSISTEIDKHRSISDVILIDVEGSANAALALAVARSHLVIVPSRFSSLDVLDGLKTVRLIEDMEKAVNHAIPHGILWSDVPVAIKSREMKNLEAQIESVSLMVLGKIHQRQAFAALFSFGTSIDELPSDEVPGLTKAKADAVVLVDTLESVLGNIHPDKRLVA